MTVLAIFRGRSWLRKSRVAIHLLKPCGVRIARVRREKRKKKLRFWWSAPGTRNIKI